MDAKALCILITLVLPGCAGTPKELPAASSANARLTTARQAEAGYANGSSFFAIPDAIRVIANVAADCERSYSLKSLFVELADSLAATPFDKETALAERLAVGDANRACKRFGREKIRDAGNLILSEFYKRGLSELGKDYLVQAQATLDAVGDKGAYLTESRKLSALLNRVELELSIPVSK